MISLETLVRTQQGQQAARPRDGRLASHLKVVPSAAQCRLGDVHGGPVLHVARDVRGQVVQQHVGKHHGLDTLASPQRQAGVEVGVVAVERALDALDAQEEEEQEAENRDRERLGMSRARGRVRRRRRSRRRSRHPRAGREGA